MNTDTWEKLKKFLEDNKIPYNIELACAGADKYIYDIVLPYLVMDLE